MAKERRIDDSWHLDKKFSIGIIFAILTQCACFIWYGAKLDSEVQLDHSGVTELTVWKEKQGDANSKIDSHLSVIDEKLAGQSKSLDHVIDILEKPVPRR